jgi:chromosome segregation ATPase
MSKKNTPIVEDAIIISETQLSEKLSNYLLTTDEMIVEGKKIIELDSIESFERLDDLIESYSAMSVNNIQDLAGYKAIVEGAKMFKKIRTATENSRKRLTEPATKYTKELIAHAKMIIEKSTPVEQHLLAEQKKFEDAKEAAERELFRKRRDLLLENAFQLTGDEFVCGVLHVSVEEVKKMEDAMFESYINHGKQELERIQSEEKRKQEEREAMQREREQLAQEREQLRLEREELRRELEELRAQKQATEKTYDIVEQPVVEQPTVEAVKEEQPKQEVITPQPEPIENQQQEDLFQAGFECFRALVLAEFRNPDNKKSRQEWIEYLEGLNPDNLTDEAF